MEKPFDLNEIIPNSSLAEIPMIFEAGKIPDELLPKTPEDHAAISILQKTFWPITEHAISLNARRLERLLPLPNLSLVLAREMIPFIRRVYDKGIHKDLAVSRDHSSELRALGSFVHFLLTAEPEEGAGQSISTKEIYQTLSCQQLWLIHIWHYHSQPEMTASGEATQKWLDATFLSVALALRARSLLEQISPADMPNQALRWLLGYEPCIDWYLVSELKRATEKSNKSLMACLTEWAGLPHVALEDTPHYSGSNSEDRRMLYFAGEASLKNGWEQHADPRAWIRSVAWNLRKHRKVQDEADHISAHANGIEIVPEEVGKKEIEACGRLGEATNKPDRQSIPLTTAREDPLAALLPASRASVEDLHAAIDWQKHCRAVGLSDEATRLGLVRFVLARKASGMHERMKPLDRELTADLLGIDVARLKAKEQELRRALPALVERLAAYGLGETKDI
jgi:hypothetical protein